MPPRSVTRAAPRAGRSRVRWRWVERTSHDERALADVPGGHAVVARASLRDQWLRWRVEVRVGRWTATAFDAFDSEALAKRAAVDLARRLGRARGARDDG